jgi:thioredoxin reductase (NADPH)
MENQNEKLIIIGSGPAGLTAAIYSSRAFLNPLVISGPEPGGQLIYTSIIENFPGFSEGIRGSELMAKMRKQAERFGARFIEATVKSANFSQKPYIITLDNQLLETQSLIIATGARPRMLGFKNEDKFLAKGIHICATCDATFYKDKEVIVVGGGDSAMEEALFLTKFAKKVYVIHCFSSLNASKIMQKRAKDSQKIEFIFNTEVSEYLGQEKLTAVKLLNKQTKHEEIKSVDGVFLAIGQIPNTEIFKEDLRLDKNGYIKAKNNVFTNKKGIFVAGDCSNLPYHQAITAAGLGCMTALEAERYLLSKE